VATQASVAYDPFGNITSFSNINPFEFQKQWLDSESDMYFLRARSYDPALGRFISKDPVKGPLAQPQSLNPYQYAYNNPVNLSDPSGKQVAQILQACANSAVNAVNLAKSLASQQQMQEEGKIIAGPGVKRVFDNAIYIAQEYGGQALDWVKKVSNSTYVASDGTKFQTRWVENLTTGEKVLYKTKFLPQ